MSEEYCSPGEAYEMLNDLMAWVRDEREIARNKIEFDAAANVRYHAGRADALQDVLNWWHE